MNKLEKLYNIIDNSKELGVTLGDDAEMCARLFLKEIKGTG